MTTLQDQIERMAARHPEHFNQPMAPAEPADFPCAVCVEHHVNTAGALCNQCQSDKARGYRVRSMAGRCANGAERDHGTRFHALPFDGTTEWGDDTSRAICGAEPGRRSVGWSSWGSDHEVTCPRCLARLARQKKG